MFFVFPVSLPVLFIIWWFNRPRKAKAVPFSQGYRPYNRRKPISVPKIRGFRSREFC